MLRLSTASSPNHCYHKDGPPQQSEEPHTPSSSLLLVPLLILLCLAFHPKYTKHKTRWTAASVRTFCSNAIATLGWFLRVHKGQASQLCL